MAGDTANRDKFFPGDSEMARRVREFDWSKTPLGPVESWPQSLLTSIRLMLNSRYPMFVWWGHELTNFYNDAYLSILGARHPKALGQPAAQVWAEIWNVVGPQTEIVMREGQATWNESILLVMERYGYTEETYFTFSYSPATDDDGNVGGVFCACTEDTKRILGERRVRMLRALAERATQAKSSEEACAIATATMRDNPYDLAFALLYLIDNDGVKARLAGATLPDALTNPALNELSCQANSPWPLGQVAESGESQIVSGLEARFGPGVKLPGGAWPEPARQAIVLPMAKPGQEQPSGFLIVGISPRLMLDDDYRAFLGLAAGHVASAIANAHAYQEEHKRVVALAEIDHAKTVFFSNVSHEFRTPLALILGPAEEMLSGALGDTTELQRAHLSTLRDNAVRLQKLVNTLLDFARVEAGRVEATYEPVDLSLMTRELASTFCSAVHRAGVLFVVNCPALDEPVYVDRDMWEKIVLNLLSNALKFTFKGTIEVSVRGAGDTVAFTVRDTGVGIPEAELPRLFQRFHRVRAASARTQEGSGIGLALVQELVKLHGGTIEVESALGKGTAFTVFIPTGSAHLPKDRLAAPRNLSSTALGAGPFIEEALRWLPDDDQAQSSPRLIAGSQVTPIPASLSPGAERILIADDNMDMRNYLRRLLELYWNVETVENGLKALIAARQQPPPDLIITDVMMPELNGFELLEQLRADVGTKTIPVILLSARAGEEAYIDGMNAGADDYILKPFGARELLARVKARLEIARVRRDTERRVTNVLDSITDGFQVIDAGWRLTYMNSEAKQTLADHGIDPEAAIGKHFWDDIFPYAVNTEIAAQLRRAMSERVPVAFESYYLPWRRWYSFRVYPLPEGGLANYFQDVTSAKQAQEKLRLSEERFRTMANSSPVMIWMTDADGKVLFLNRTYREFFRISADDGAAFDWPEIIHPEDREAYVAEFKTALQKRQTFHHRARFRHSDGQWRWFESRGNPVLDDAGNMAGFIGSSSDITDIYESQQALKELGQRKDEFLANMSHEIRSPLTGIMGYTDILLTRLKDPGDIECLHTIKESGDYLIEIVNDILDLSKIEAGKLVLNITPVSAHAVLNEVQALMELRAKQKRLILALRYDGVMPETIRTDRTRLRQILINLVSNAIKFTQRGRVQMIARFLEDPRSLQIEVSDTGIGIAREHQDILFQPFTQADTTSTRKYGGTGLGLTITKRLVEMLGGTISFESELNKGTTFRVTIPVGLSQNTGKPAAASLEMSHSLDDKPLLGHHVLVVDDREEICNLLTRYITEAGGRADVASGGQAAIDAIGAAEQTDRFDAVILDIQMPGMDGYEVTRRLRAGGLRTPIIALTAGAMVGDREKCLQAGMDDYLTKPIDRPALLRLVARHARKFAQASGSEQSKLKILVVDDSQAACRLLTTLLEKRGHVVRAAYDGKSALAEAAEFVPDVVLLDIRLPDMNGYEVMQHLRDRDRLGRARFIALSGYHKDDAPRASSIEFDHFLQKPLNIEYLDSLLHSISVSPAVSPSAAQAISGPVEEMLR